MPKTEILVIPYEGARAAPDHLLRVAVNRDVPEDTGAHRLNLSAELQTLRASLVDRGEDPDLLPDQVLTSSALRTRETLMRLALPQDIPVHATRDLYLASADQIMDHLRKVQAQTVLILGHNPGIGNCAATLLATPVEHPKFRQYPSGATLVATFDIADWSDARWQNANARHFVVPREL